MIAMTDPERSPSATALAERLPEGSAIIVRHFGRPHYGDIERAISIARARTILVLISADPSLALSIGADGLHIPQRLLGALRSHAGSFDLVTASAHNPLAIRMARKAGVDAVIVSPVFVSQSVSAKRPLGPFRLKSQISGVDIPIYALGGVNSKTVMRLSKTGACGIALVGSNPV